MNNFKEENKPILCTSYDERMKKGLPFAADPSLFKDASGKSWLVLGNFWNGIHVVELDRDGRIKGQGDAENPPIYTFVARGPSMFSSDGRHDKGGGIGSSSIHYNK
jgi:beta-xylosidase